MAESEEPTPQLGSADSMPPPSGEESRITVPAEAAEGEEKEGAGEGEAQPSKSASKTGKGQPESFRPKNGCQKCCGSIMQCCANDALYGSWIGPHPVSFMCICKPCKKCFSPRCARPLCVASVVTKIMNFFMMGCVALLCCFFIFPYPGSGDTAPISSFFPCNNKHIKNEEHNGGCAAHAGYFMTYRAFLALAMVMLTNCFAMADVTSTTDDPYRKRIHHGFWLYKFFYLVVLMILFFFMPTPEMDFGGYFELVCATMGNIAHVILSFLILTVILDIIEVWVVSIGVSGSGWANFMYSLITCAIFIADIVAFIAIAGHFGFNLEYDVKERVYDSLTSKNRIVQIKDSVKGKDAPDGIIALKEKEKVDPDTDGATFYANEDGIAFLAEKELKRLKANISSWPYTNCVDGKYKEVDEGETGFFGYELNSTHSSLIGTMLIVNVILMVVMFLKQRISKRFPFQGWLQVSVIILFNLFYLWSALFNSKEIQARPHCNWALDLKKTLQMTNWAKSHSLQSNLLNGSHDTYFRYTGFFHGLLIIFTLFYYAFVHGPRTKTAPLSLGFRHFVGGGKYDRVPVFPDPKDAPPEFKRAVENLDVWDDETEAVGHSWSLFYFAMTLGSLSLMMAMTNFTNPWAEKHYNTSEPSMFFKFFTALGATLAYICLLICPCTRIYKAYEAPKRKRRIIKKTIQQKEEGQEDLEQVPEEAVVIEVIEEEDEAW